MSMPDDVGNEDILYEPFLGDIDVETLMDEEILKLTWSHTTGFKA